MGRQGGGQPVSLGDGCLSKGYIMHELMHAVGFFHEQSRWDRNEYVSINWENIRAGMQYNFLKYQWSEISNLSYPYDFGN